MEPSVLNVALITVARWGWRVPPTRLAPPQVQGARQSTQRITPSSANVASPVPLRLSASRAATGAAKACSGRQATRRASQWGRPPSAMTKRPLPPPGWRRRVRRPFGERALRRCWKLSSVQSLTSGSPKCQDEFFCVLSGALSLLADVGPPPQANRRGWSLPPIYAPLLAVAAALRACSTQAPTARPCRSRVAPASIPPSSLEATPCSSALPESASPMGSPEAVSQSRIAELAGRLRIGRYSCGQRRLPLRGSQPSGAVQATSKTKEGGLGLNRRGPKGAECAAAAPTRPGEEAAVRGS